MYSKLNYIKFLDLIEHVGLQRCDDLVIKNAAKQLLTEEYENDSVPYHFKRIFIRFSFLIMIAMKRRSVPTRQLNAQG